MGEAFYLSDARFRLLGDESRLSPKPKYEYLTDCISTLEYNCSRGTTKIGNVGIDAGTSSLLIFNVFLSLILV